MRCPEVSQIVVIVPHALCRKRLQRNIGDVPSDKFSASIGFAP
jgi:hypothetical protein